MVPKGGAAAPPFLFLLFVALFFEGGDWPPASLALRTVPFLLGGLYLLRRDAFRFAPTIPDLLVLGLWAVEAASLLRPGYRWITYQWFLHHTAALIFYGLVRALPRDGSERFARGAAALLLAGAAFEVALAAYQTFALGNGRPGGTFPNASFLAEFLACAGVIAWYARGETDGGSPSRRWWTAALIVALIAGIALTKSRGGVVLAVAAGGYLAAERFGWRRAAIVAAAAVAVLFLVPNPVRDRFLARGEAFSYERLSMWKAAWRIFAAHPLGVGVGHFKYFWQAARDPAAGSIVRYAKFAPTPHSEFFSVLSELGLPGIAAFAGLGLAGAASLRKASRSGGAVAGASASVLLVSFLDSFFQTNYHVLGLLFVAAAALAVVSSRAWSPLFEKEVRSKGAVRGAALVLLLAMLGYSVMTYAGAVLAGMGRDALEAGRLSEAVRRFSDAAAADPLRATHPDQASAAAFRRYEAGNDPDDFSRAIEWEVDAASLNPMDYLYQARLGFLYARAADRFAAGSGGKVVGAALRSYDRALSWNPHDANLRHQKAVVMRSAGLVDESRREIETALRDEPAFAKGWVFLGEALERSDPGRSRDAYRRALALHDGYARLAREPEERDFLDIDADAVRRRIGAPQAPPGR